jgi:hypothetical protein
MSSSRTLALAMLAGTMSIAACTDAPTMSGGELPTAARIPGSPSGGAVTFDDEMARIAQEELPGFAGIYLDDHGKPVVRIARSASPTLGTALMPRARASLRLDPEERVRVEEVEHDFPTLKGWHDALPVDGSARGVIWSDIDERQNKIVVGVADPAARALVERAARNAGVPAAALEVRITKATTDFSTVRDYASTKVGGIQIARLHQGQHGEVQSPCTLGFITRQEGVNRFVTASHCSYQQYALDTSSQHQPTLDPSWKIGVEYADPSLTGTCFLDQGFPPCRYSDASMYSFIGGVTSGKGLIAQTHYPVSGDVPGPVQIYGPEPHMFITQKWAGRYDAPVGTEMHKMGRTTGWTAGEVNRTCVNAFPLRCIWTATFYAENFDSGSPVFSPLDFPNVALHGVLGGGFNNDVDVWYTTLWGIEKDMQLVLDVTVDVPPPPPPPPSLSVTILGASTIEPSASCNYSATVSGGAGEPYSIEWYVDGVLTWTGAQFTTSSNSSFQLSAKATDANNVIGFGFLNVTVTWGAPPCYDQ